LSITARHARWLWRYLWAWALGVLIVVWAGLTLVAYVTGLHEADEIGDGQLLMTARLLLAQPPVAGQSVPVLEVPAAPVVAQSYAPALQAAVWLEGELAWETQGWATRLPTGLPPGFHRLSDADGLGPGHWRIHVAETPAGVTPHRKVVVGLDAERRTWLGADIAEHIVRPALVMLPVLAWLLAWAIRRGLRPLHELSLQIESLDMDAGRVLVPAQPYREFRPTVEALNRLLERLKTQIERERHFNADLAHELRTPLTALVWQARMAQGPDPQQRADALQGIEQDALRAGDILSQLLAWSRAQNASPSHQQPVDLCALAQRVVGEHVAQAHARGQGLGLALPAGGVEVHGHPLMLALALRNLVDNALRHTGPGAEVEVGVGQTPTGGVQLWVQDTGAVTDPGEAGTPQAGLGIGLTLVRRIAAGHRAELHHEKGLGPWRNRYALVWPAIARVPVP